MQQVWGSRSVRWAVAGTGLSLGAPLGWLALRLGGGVSPALEVTTHAGLYLYLTLSTLLVFTSFGAVLGRMADRLEEARRQMEQQALTDALTSLWNARVFRARLSSECARAARSGQPLTLLMLDVDHFKRINDAYGHPTGDVVLAHVARLLAAGVRAADTVCRVGGEEFAILCPHTRPEEGLALAERLCQSVAGTPVVAEGWSLRVTTSIGVAGHRPGEAPQALVCAADAALYEAKRLGRNRVALAPPPTPRRGEGAADASGHPRHTPPPCPLPLPPALSREGRGR